MRLVATLVDGTILELPYSECGLQSHAMVPPSPGPLKKSESVGCSVMPNSVTPWKLTGSSGHGILQARKLEWVAIPFSRGSSRTRD